MTGTIHPHPDDLTPTSPPAAPSGSIVRLSADRLGALLGPSPSGWAADLATRLALTDWHEHGGRGD